MDYTIPYWLRIAGVAITLLPTAVSASDQGVGDPLTSRNLVPVYGSLGVPVMANAAGLDKGQWQGSWGLHWASHSHAENDDGQALEYDGETRRHDVSLAIGLGGGVTASLNIPWITHEGGSLDPLIEGWHKLWGMPNGERDRQGEDLLRFSLSGDDGFLLEDKSSGIGDVEATLAWQFWSGAGNASLAAFAQYKHSSGDVGDFTGSGDRGLAVGVRYSAPACLWDQLSCHGQVGIVDVGEIAYAPDAKDQLLYGGVSLAWMFLPELALIGQLEFQEQPFSGGPLDESGTPILGTLGLRWQLGQGWRLEGQFSEDLQVGSAPDITFRFSASRRW